jgi:signal peptidase I
MQLLRVLWLWLQAAGILVAIIAVCWLGAQACLHLRILDVQTGSMQPTFAPDDALIMQRLDVSALRPGMIVSYRSSRNPNDLITHRVAWVSSDGKSFRTKGDALGTLDPPVRSSLLVGRVVTILPGMGKILHWLRSWPGLITCVYIPVAAIIFQELYRLECHYTRWVYESP